jgi:isopenicillin N synthase-like dioxygenase
MSFSSIPILDLSLAKSPSTKPAFLSDLRNALLDVGFLYISNTGIDQSLIDAVITNGKAFFDLPDEAKLAVQMKNAPSFLGSQRHFLLFPHSQHLSMLKH